MNVNPPPQLQIPPQFLKDPVTRTFFNQQRIILFQLWQKLGGNDDPFEKLNNEQFQSLNSFTIQALRKSAGLPEFTIDTTGFTTDSTELTTDKVIA